MPVNSFRPHPFTPKASRRATCRTTPEIPALLGELLTVTIKQHFAPSPSPTPISMLRAEPPFSMLRRTGARRNIEIIGEGGECCLIVTVNRLGDDLVLRLPGYIRKGAGSRFRLRRRSVRAANSAILPRDREHDGITYPRGALRFDIERRATT